MTHVRSDVRLLCASALACALLASGCSRAPEWRSYTEVFTEAPTAAVPKPEPVTSLPNFKWTAPKGWLEGPGGDMRLATFAVTGAVGQGTCTIVALGGDAGGMRANIVRWIGQLKLSLAEAALDAFIARQPSLETEGGYKATIVDLTELAGTDGSNPASMLASYIAADGGTCFIKLTGPSALLREEKDRFTALCKSLRK